MTSKFVLNKEFIFCTFLRITLQVKEIIFHSLSNRTIKFLLPILLINIWRSVADKNTNNNISIEADSFCNRSRICRIRSRIYKNRRRKHMNLSQKQEIRSRKEMRILYSKGNGSNPSGQTNSGKGADMRNTNQKSLNINYDVQDFIMLSPQFPR